MYGLEVLLEGDESNKSCVWQERVRSPGTRVGFKGKGFPPAAPVIGAEVWNENRYLGYLRSKGSQELQVDDPCSSILPNVHLIYTEE